MVRRTFTLLSLFFRAFVWTAIFWIVLVQLTWLWLNKAPESVQTWLDLISSQRLQVEHIEVSPSLLVPKIQLYGLHWKDTGIHLDVQRLSFDLSWLKNLAEKGVWGQNLLIEHLRLHVSQTASSKKRGAPSLKSLEAWLEPRRYQLWLPFRRIVIKKARIEYAPWTVTLPSVNLEKRRVFRLQGDAQIDYQNQPLWHLGLNGLLRADWLGRLHSGWLQARTLETAPLAHLASLFETRWKNGEMALDFYLTLDHGAPAAVLKVKLDHLKVMGRKGLISSLGATLFWQDGRGEQRFSIAQWLLNDQVLQNVSPAYVIWRDGTLNIAIEALSLEPFRPALAVLWPQWDWSHTHATLSDLKADFRLRPLQLAALSGLLQKIEWPQVGDFPGVALRGVTLSGGHERLDVAFEQPLRITWDVWPQPSHRITFLKGMHWRGALGNGRLQPVAFRVDKTMPGQLQLTVHNGKVTGAAHLEPETLQRLKRYLPYGLMGQDLRKWLSEGLVSGRVSPVELHVKGRLDDWASFAQKGNLEAKARLQGAVLRFKPDWPVLKKLNASVRFEPWRLHIKADQGVLQGIQLKEVQVAIGPLNEPDIALKLFGRAQGTALAVQALALKSPLARKLGIEKLLGKKITLEKGEVEGQVALWVPLYGLARRVENVDVQVALKGVDVAFWGRERVEGLNGTLHITQQSALSGKITGRFQKSPLELQIRTDVRHPALILNARGRIDLARYVADVKGVGRMQLAARIPFARQAPLDFSGSLKPDLKVNRLPRPLDQVIPHPLHLRGRIDHHQLKLQAHWGDYLGANAQVDLDGHLQHLTVVMGEKPAVANALLQRTGKDVLLLLNAKQIAISPLQDWWAKQRRLLPANHHSDQLPLPLILAARMQKLQYHAQVFKQVVLTATSLDKDRIGFEMEADKLKGTGIYMPDQRDLALSINRLMWDAAPQPATCRPRTRPQDLHLFLIGENIQFRQYRFDHVHFNLYSDPAQVRIEGLKLQARGGRLKGEGNMQWRYRENDSHLNLDLYAKPVETFLDWADFGDSGFTGEKAHVQAHLQWFGSPDCFDLKTVEGSAQLRFDDGLIKRAQLVLAKIIGLLSVDSLLRNLKVTLNQLQYSALVYDYINAKLKFKRGVAAIEDFELEAPSVHATLKGQVDYVRRRYNLKATVSPKVAGTLTTLATLVGLANPVTAISSYLLLKNVPGMENNLVSYRYMITGPWEKPNIVNLETGKSILSEQKPSAREETIEEFLDHP